MEWFSSTAISVAFHTSAGQTYFMCALYIVLGTVAMLANAINLSFYLVRPDLRTQYRYLIAVDFGEVINGLSFVLTGFGRGTALLSGYYHSPASIHYCFFQTYWPIVLILGTEITALLTLLMSVERIFSVQAPAYYERLFFGDKKYFWFVGTAFIQFLFLLWAGLSAYHNFRETSDQHCAIIGSTSDEFAIFHFLFLILAYVVSFTSLVTVYWFQHRNRNLKKVKRNSGPRIQIFILLTGIDVILVAVPGITMLGAKWQWWTPDDVVIGLTYSTTGFLSLVHIGFNLTFHKNFKYRVLRCYHRIVNSHADDTTRVVGTSPPTVIQVTRTN